MAVFEEEHNIYLWRLDTQEMVSFNHHFGYAIHVIHSPLTNYLFIRRNFTVETVGRLCDRLKNDLGDKASSHFICRKYLSITRWPQAFDWL